MDYYERLGVDRNADDKQLKSAFKKKSMEYHPDRGGDSEKFKEINEAYQALKDPQKRQMYDQFGTTDPQQANFSSDHFGPQGFHGSFDINDLFSQFGFNQGRQQRNKDIRLRMNIHFKDIFRHKADTISYQLPSGKQEILDIRFPPGIKTGDQMNLTGYGDDSIKQLPRGNLIVQFNVIPDKDWERNGLNIITQKNVDILDLILGTTIEIVTPTGKSISLNIPKGSKPGTTFSISNYGIPDTQTGKQGNIHVKLNGTMPKLNDTELKKIQEVKNGISLRTK